MVLTKLHPGAKWSFRINSYVIAVFFWIILTIVIYIVASKYSSFVDKYIPDGQTAIIVLFLYFILLAVFTLIFSEIFARMSYARWFYEITNDGIRIEHGIIWKKYVSIPYHRIQNVNILRGLIARIIGFSTLKIETAGNSSSFAEGDIPALGIDEAEKLREFILEKISKRNK